MDIGAAVGRGAAVPFRPRSLTSPSSVPRSPFPRCAPAPDRVPLTPDETDAPVAARRRSDGAGSVGRMTDDRAADPASDAALMARVVARDADAFAALYDRHAAAVHGLARAVLHDPHLAEEVTHDVFLQLWRAPAGFDPSRGVFAGWLLRIARNRAIDQLRRRRDRPFAAMTAPGTDDALPEPIANLASADPDPADQALLRLAQEDVRAAVGRLSADHQRLLGLAYFEGLTQREIAARLDRPLGTVKSQIRAAMRGLSGLLGGPERRPDTDPAPDPAFRPPPVAPRPVGRYDADYPLATGDGS